MFTKGNGGGPPKGNKNASRTLLWRRAIEGALEQYQDDKIAAGYALHRIADQVVRLALKGDLAAIQEIGNRLDGRPKQVMQVEDENGIPRGITVVFSDSRVPAETPPALHS